MAGTNPIRAARNAAQRLYDIHAEQQALREEIDGLRADNAGLQATLAHQMEVLRAIYEEEPGQRRRLWDLRHSPDYGRPFEVEDPLVTVFVTTYSNAEGLAGRSIPSILAQTHSNLEVIVVGDAASPEVEEAARSFDDPRLRFENLTIRGQYPSDPQKLWLVAGTAPANEGLQLARGEWIGMNCDDDAFTPDHVEVLLAEARRRRLELVWGKIRRIDPDGTEHLLGVFPPESHNWGVQAALMHRGLQFFHYDILDGVFGDPGDWGWVRRLMRAGVRMGMVDDVVVDYYPGLLWR